jgi:phosphohistidine phosphatase
VRRLYLLRHAKSSWDDPSLADHERPLAPRGVKAGRKLARHLRREGIGVDLVICSSARRTRETLELIRPALGDAEVEIEDGLYAADSERLLARLRQLPGSAGAVLLISHNPGLHDLALMLAPDDERLREKFPTGALASFAVATRWSRLGESRAELLAYIVPREIS